MDIFYEKNKIIVSGLAGFSLRDTFACGQCFRWEENPDGSYRGIAFGHITTVSIQEDRLIFHETSRQDFQTVWFDYFDLSRDYDTIKIGFCKDPTLKKCVEFAGGIRILNQEPWEALCSFILSQNNNIARIKGIISRLCEHFGDKLGDLYSFPSAKQLSSLSENDLAPLRAGFRSKYVLDAARKVSDGTVDLNAIFKMSAEEGIAELTEINGVGIKVASCALLFGFKKSDAFPVDVWIKRALESLYPQGFPDEFVCERGIAQQYLFHYVRLNKDILPSSR